MAGCQKGSGSEKIDHTPQEENGEIKSYITSADKKYLFREKDLSFGNTKSYISNITIDPSEKYQQMEGFGAAVTGSTCYNLLQMTKSDRSEFLKKIFDPNDGMGYGYIRISIGCSDFSLDEYTCCDTRGIENFDLPEYDKRDLVPILKEILEINPSVKIMGSPWTCPRWMKVKSLTDLTEYDSWTGGRLNPAYYGDYAEYFVKWIKTMQAQDIPITSITVQNEPLNRGNSASLYMTWEEEATFIGKYLGPAFEKNGITAKIITYDHNFNFDDINGQNDYPLNIYADPDAVKYASGSAWHAYGGSPSVLDHIHDKYPGKEIYFTEMSIGEWSAPSKDECFKSDLIWNMENCFLGTIKRYCRAVIMWNLLLDSDHGPNRPGGCNTCYGCIDISKNDYKTVTMNSHYYNISHFSKVVKPGARRIKSSGPSSQDLQYVAFLNPDGSYALVILNKSDNDTAINISDGTKTFPTSLPAKSVNSYRWKD
jgi:glucosylceramidase